MTASRAKRYSLIILATWAFMPTPVVADSCEQICSTAQTMAAQDYEKYIQQALEAADYKCAIKATELQAQTLSNMQGEEGLDARFALRNFMLRLSGSKLYRPNVRLEIIKAAVLGLAGASHPTTPSETKFNVLLALKAGEKFRQQRDTDSWLEALTLAIQLDLRVVEAEQTLKPWMVQTIVPDSTETYKYLEWIVTLAELTRGAKSYTWLRASLAFASYYNGSTGPVSDHPDVIAARASQLLRLAGALSEPYDDFYPGANWQWKLYMKAGTAYLRIGMQEEGNVSILRAIELVRAIKNPDSRLSEYRSVLDYILGAKFDRSQILALVEEIKNQANSYDTLFAKETRESLSRIIKNWELDKTP